MDKSSDVLKIDTATHHYSAPFLRQLFTSPTENSQALKRAIGLWHVTSLLASAQTEEQVAKIILDEAFLVLHAYNGDIILKKDDGKLYVAAYKKYSKKWAAIHEDRPLLTRLVINSKKPYYIRDINDISPRYEHARKFFAASKAKSAMITPLKIKRNVIGVLQFTYRKTQLFTTEEKLFIQTLANQCALSFIRVKSQQDLTAAKEQLEGIVQNTTDGIYLQDETGEIIFINSVCAEIFGYTQKKNITTLTGKQLGKNVTLHAESGERMEICDLTVDLVTKKKLSARWIVKANYKKQNIEKWLLIKSIVVNKDRGITRRILTTIHDITPEKELDLRKDYFISIASHELKTPITSLKLFIEMLGKHLSKQHDERSTLYIDKITEQTMRLQKLIMELLDVSRIQKGKMRYNEENLIINELLATTIQDLQLFTRSHTIHLDVVPAIRVKGDRFRLYQVITNLITNAVKYSPQQKKVLVSMKQNGNEVIISVQDFGIGITKSQQRKIFDRFYQVTDKSRKDSSGLGMGLFISREIIEQHRGKIWVESRKGKGTTFSFSLPIVTKE